MTFFIHHSWQIIEKLESYCGTWYYQIRLKNYLIRFIICLITISIIIPVVLRFRKELGINRAIVVENFIAMLVYLSFLFKLAMACKCNKKMQEIYKKVNDHFGLITDPQEAFVLSSSAEHGMKLCITYMGIFFTGSVMFNIVPFVKMFLGFLFKYNELEKLIPFYVDFNGFIDEDKYYVHIMLYSTVCNIVLVIVNFSYDFPFIMNVRYACTLFEIVKVRLQEASGFLEEFHWSMLDFTTADNKAYEHIIQAIDMHNEALEVVSMIEEAYSFSWFILLLENAFIFSGGVYILILNLDQPFQLFRYSIFFIALFAHFSVQFILGQMIIDSSSSVFDACYNFKWYLASPKTRKLLTIMMSRSFKPCEITGGGFFVLRVEAGGKIIKGGYSYLSVFNG